MHYFISSRQDYVTSAIELAQVKRLEIFDSLKQPAEIIELEYNYFHEMAHQKLGDIGRVINLYQFFQKLNYLDKSADEKIVDQLLDGNKYEVKEQKAYLNGKIAIKVNFAWDRLYYVDFLDKYGYTVKRNFYDCGVLSHTEYFDDQAKLVMREYFDNDGQVVIRQYYRKAGDEKVLSLIELTYQGQNYRFLTQAEMDGFFLDQIAERDDEAVFYCDRTTTIVPAFQQMKVSVPRYVIFHSALTPSGDEHDDLYTVFQPIIGMIEQGTINGLISSTKREAQHVAKIFKTDYSYAIPVTFINDIQPVPFSERNLNKIIAVARVSPVKQLDQLIKVIIELRQSFPQLELYIYGSTTHKPTEEKLYELVQQHHAENFIHFEGYQQNLDQVYDLAALEVLTSESEGFAMAVLEAQSHGVPVVSYDINYGPDEIIQDDVSGKLVKANDTQALCQVLEDLLNHPEKLAEYSKNSYQTSKRYDFAHVREDWQKFLKKEQIFLN